MEKYPLVHFLIKDYLHLRDRTKVRYLLSKDVSCDVEDYDISYEKELNGYTSLLKIKRCDSCLFYRKYKNLNVTECSNCCMLFCKWCSEKGNSCRDCYI